MKTIKLLLMLGVVAIASVVGFIYSGNYEMGADQPHWPTISQAIEVLRDRSIARAARGVEVPADLADPERIRRGAGNYDAMCTGCHLKPGLSDSEIRKGLYPQPPALTHAVDADDPLGSAAARYWIIKHGIKMTGMPAWSLGGVDDGTIWDMVALIGVLPELTPDDYAALVASSEGHTHAGADSHGGGHHGDGRAKDEPAPSDHVDAPGAPPHSHGPKAAKKHHEETPHDR